MATVHELSATIIYFIVEEQTFISSDRKTAHRNVLILKKR